MACFQSLWGVAVQTQQKVWWLRQLCPAGLGVLPAFQTSSTVNKDKLPHPLCGKVQLWGESTSHVLTLLCQRLTWKKAGLVFRSKLRAPKDKIYTAWCHDTFTKVLKSFSPSVSLLKNSDNYSNCIIYKNPILLIGTYTYKHYSTFSWKD